MLFRSDISFVGASDNKIRNKLFQKINEIKNLKIFIKKHNFWIKSLEEKNASIFFYEKIMQDSKFVLCPRGRGLNSIRFFETLSFGRIPILISDDTQLPLESKINYDEFIIRLPENQLGDIENYVIDFQNKKNIHDVSKKCRQIWEKYFSENQFEYFLKESILEKNKHLMKII